MQADEYVFPRVQRFREEDWVADRYSHEARQQGKTLSVYLRETLREAHGLPPPPPIERKALGAPSAVKAERGPDP